jgi:cytochrome c-type biogenesis protein CcmE
MKRRTRTIIIFLLLLAVIAAAFGYYLYNKGPLDVQDSSATAVNAKELYQKLSTDSVSALKMYAGKVLEVGGQVTSVSVNQNKQQVIFLKTGTETGYINCTMEQNAEVKVDQQVTIKGICSGIGQGDPDVCIQGDVYLTRCYLKK